MSTRFISRVTTHPTSLTSKDCGVDVEATSGRLVYTAAPKTNVIAGALGGAVCTHVGLTVEEDGGEGFHRTKVIFKDTPMVLRNTEQGVGIQIYDFPKGYLYLLGGIGDLTVTTLVLASLNASAACKWGVGTLTQSTTSLTTTEQDLIDATAFTSSATASVANAATTQSMVTPAFFDGTTTAINAFFNISVDQGGDIDADATVLINGTLFLTWVNLGAYALT